MTDRLIPAGEGRARAGPDSISRGRHLHMTRTLGRRRRGRSAASAGQLDVDWPELADGVDKCDHVGF